jgi:hypothetical protein
MREREIERKLVQAVRVMGGIALKIVSPGFDGMPDRLILFPGGRAAFAEIKKYGMKPRPMQLQRHGMLRGLGFKVFVIDDEEQIKTILMEILGGDAK